MRNEYDFSDAVQGGIPSRRRRIPLLSLLKDMITILEGGEYEKARINMNRSRPKPPPPPPAPKPRKASYNCFLEGTKIPPYFKDRSDWQFVQGLVEATIKEKLRSFERAK